MGIVGYILIPGYSDSRDMQGGNRDVKNLDSINIEIASGGNLNLLSVYIFHDYLLILIIVGLIAVFLHFLSLYGIAV